MRGPRRAIGWAELAAVALLAALCMVGAFLGPTRARAMFNSPPLGAFWILLMLGAAGRAATRAAVAERVALLGVVLVLAGGLWGSDAGHRLAGRLRGEESPPGGYMFLPRGQLADDLLDPGFEHRIARLPFQLMLREFRFEVDGETGAVREYAGHVAVVDGGREAADVAVEVNRPLHHGGYQFTLQEGDFRNHEYAVLRVESDAGMAAVYGGMALLCVGVFWLCWLRPAGDGGEGEHGD